MIVITVLKTILTRHNLEDQVNLDVKYETFSIQQLGNEGEGLCDAKFA